MWYLAVGGVVLECVTDSMVPGVAVLLGLVVAAAEWCDRFGNCTGHGACPGDMVKSGGAVGINKRTDLPEPFGCFSLSSLKFGELGCLLALRLLLDGDVLFETTQTLPVVGDGRF